MAKFARTYPDKEFVQQAVAQIPWGHNIVLLDKISDPDERIWYIEACRENSWSRAVLIHQIESGLYRRQAIAQKVSNFEARLPAPHGELAVQTMKDPYVFDFIPFRGDMVERDIEDALVRDVTKLLLELGTGFAFLGNQYHLNVGGDDFYIDLLFYNLNLRSYVVIELKTGEFKPEYAGQLNFYLSAVDGILKKEQDNPTIGLLLCKSKNNLVAEYSLKDMSKPIGVSEYSHQQSACGTGSAAAFCGGYSKEDQIEKDVRKRRVGRKFNMCIFCTSYREVYPMGGEPLYLLFGSNSKGRVIFHDPV